MQKEDRKVCPPGVGFVVIVVVHLLGWEDNIKGGKSVPGRCVLVYFAQHAQERGLLEMPLVFWGGTAAVQAPLFFRPGWTLRGERVCWVWLVSPKGHLVGDRPFSFLAGNQYRLLLTSFTFAPQTTLLG
jgi:hypothetical protein